MNDTIESLKAEVDRLEGLLGQVWDINRDPNRSWERRSRDTMEAIREPAELTSRPDRV